MEDPKVIATLLSLFSGLMFGVLIKIPDKFKDLESKVFECIQSEIKSYSILVALFCIFFALSNSFFPSLVDLDLNQFYFEKNLNKINYYETLEFICIVSYRILLVNFLFNFVFYIFKAVTNLYEFMLYEFNKIK
jgi:hypothetical protein